MERSPASPANRQMAGRNRGQRGAVGGQQSRTGRWAFVLIHGRPCAYCSPTSVSGAPAATCTEGRSSIKSAQNGIPDSVRELKTWISEKAGPEATVEGLMSVIPYFRISPERGREILGEVEHAVAGWRKKGRAIGMTEPELDQFSDAFEHPEREAARKTISAM